MTELVNPASSVVTPQHDSGNRILLLNLDITDVPRPKAVVAKS